MRAGYRLLACLPLVLAAGAGACAPDAGPDPAPQRAETAAPIRAITLSTGGVAEIRRQVQTGPRSTVRFDVPLAQVDDILKSLVVRDPQGRVAGMTLDGLSPVQETFASLPFTPQDLASPATLAASLQGVPVRATSGGRGVQGRILGVAEQDAGPAGPQAAPRKQPVLSVLTEAGQIQALALGADATLDVLDEALRRQLAQAAQASGRARADGVRSIEIELDGPAARQVGISYVAAAPVWKTAYRLVAGEQPGQARLQAWAVVENATAEDWREVELTLAAGSPVLLAQQLHQRYWHDRAEVPVAASAAQAPAPDRYQAEAAQDAVSASVPQRVAGAMGRAAAGAAPPPAPAAAPVPIAQAADAAAAQEGETQAAYRLPHPVSLAAGKTLSLPYLDVQLPAERLSVFQAGRASRHPVAAVLLENTAGASLPAGLLTVYDAREGHVGDAQLAGLPAGQSRLASFAEDRKVTVTTDTQPQERITEIALADGVLRATRLLRQVTTYAVQGAPDAPRTVLIEHPRRSGWTFRSPAQDGQTPTHYRLRLQLEAGASGRVEAVAERSQVEEVALLDTDAQTLLLWSGTAADPKTAARLEALSQRRAELSAAEDRVRRAAQALEQAQANQARIRENLGAVPPDSELGQRYARMLAEEEDRIAALQQAMREAERQAEQAHQAMAHALPG